MLVFVDAPRFPCACCSYPTLAERPGGTYEICPVCFWEDDPLQFDDPMFRGGANTVSLLDARESFAAIGACEPRHVTHVRPPTPEEQRARAVPRG